MVLCEVVLGAEGGAAPVLEVAFEDFDSVGEAVVVGEDCVELVDGGGDAGFEAFDEWGFRGWRHGGLLDAGGVGHPPGESLECLVGGSCEGP